MERVKQGEQGSPCCVLGPPEDPARLRQGKRLFKIADQVLDPLNTD